MERRPASFFDGPIISFSFGLMFLGGCWNNINIQIIFDWVNHFIEFLVAMDGCNSESCLIISPQEFIDGFIILVVLFGRDVYCTSVPYGSVNASEEFKSGYFHTINTKFNFPVFFYPMVLLDNYGSDFV